MQHHILSANSTVLKKKDVGIVGGACSVMVTIVGNGYGNLLWSRGGWNDNTTRKWVIKNILNIYT